MVMIAIFQDHVSPVYIRRCQVLYNYPATFHKNIEIIHVTKGSLDYTINEEVVHMEEGDICFAFPYAIHSSRYQETEFTLVSFDPNLCVPFATILLNQTPKVPRLDKENVPEIVPELIQRVSEVADREGTYTDGTIVGYLSAIVGECLPALDLIPIEEIKANTVQEILIYCAEHYRDEISLKRIAEDLHLSPNYISSIFAKKLKISLRDYINNMRTSEASYLLTHTQLRITEIMEECGFKNQSTFNKVFQENCGMTHRQYRTERCSESEK
jgi:AraC-like DNA-binding protein